MPLAGCGLRRFEAQTAEIHLFQTKSHTRHSLSLSSVAMWRGKRVQSYHVTMRELLLACRVLAWDKVDAGNGAVEEWQLSSIIGRIQASRSYFIIL
jgi:hypothetical protein